MGTRHQETKKSNEYTLTSGLTLLLMRSAQHSQSIFFLPVPSGWCRPPGPQDLHLSSVMEIFQAPQDSALHATPWMRWTWKCCCLLAKRVWKKKNFYRCQKKGLPSLLLCEDSKPWEFAKALAFWGLGFRFSCISQGTCSLVVFDSYRLFQGPHLEIVMVICYLVLGTLTFELPWWLGW